MGADQIGTTPRLLSVVSYNIHQCVGSDRRRDATRIAAILKELNADIIGLQEVHSAHDGTFEAYQLRYLAESTGNHVVSGPNVTKANSEYGNVLLTRHSVVRVNRLDLSVPGREARGAIDADIAIGNHVVRVIVSHLGLRARERRYQTKRLLGLLGQEKTSPIVALLDINEWFPLGAPILRFNEEFGKAPCFRSFPAFFPLFSLDRVWVKPCAALIKVEPYITSVTRVASDHLPLVATIDIERF
ncbi:MAG TPA: endonuclease/exonuclease/phosphatase family protein [Candidatus Binatia bacterium]|jgi:endonuclease/exonuclease/phosphatase family metal-dependent hydrolase|nr:endonuclease/exonuclease/phosphatase family protein [Candidatus Binatia bacterium]